jgi:pimeloyl-ACP methyl ester carboxylesterase
LYSADVIDELPRVGVPVLWLRGTQDALVRRRTSAVARSVCPDIQFAAVAASHLLLPVAPRQAREAVTDFDGQPCGL